MPNLDVVRENINHSMINANNFETKLTMIRMIQKNLQFCGSMNEDPNQHLKRFLTIYNPFKYNGVIDDAIRLRLFHFSLINNAFMWLDSQPMDSINTWDELASRFLAKYFLPSKTMKLQMDITNFRQLEGELLYEAYEYFKLILCKCPYHGSLEGASCGTIHEMAMNSYIWSNEWFTYRNKQLTMNAVSCEDKFQHILKRLNHLKISSAKP
ncbi:oligopeptide transporter 4-like [Gossypium australe]|uniref:Oligopeptide transporter 4-like n=1 Tax=Gossypium australe TaxID=47621 RepID=A0A5B6UTE6_9ROSI|nr:oligopeptide transporter 4-like [Gossypium australe]